MIPVLTPEQMRAVDAAAPEAVEVLIRRAAAAVCREAIEFLGGSYGRRVVVVAGPGNNGNDGRVAAELLRARGVKVTVFSADEVPEVLPACDLVIDAAYGTGFRGTYDAPVTSAPVLAVDICSGLSGLTGESSGRPVTAERTVTFAALKPGLLFGAGPVHSGEVRLVDIGLDAGSSTTHLVDDGDLVEWVPERSSTAHKWRHAVWIVAGTPGMSGAARLCAAAALRGGSGYVRLSTPGSPQPPAPTEAVLHDLPATGWAADVRSGADRFAAIAVGPGLGREDATVDEVRELVATLDRPLVVDGDALWALGPDAAEQLRGRSSPTVLTPHDGEFERLTGTLPGPDRITAAKDLAASTGAVVLLKGPTTVVASPEGACLLVRSGDARLATAGTGDVLTGIVTAHLALGADPWRGTAAAAQLHGLAARCGPARGLIASDLITAIPDAWRRLAAAGHVTSR